MLLKNKVAVVTGGSNGIGAATVRMLADEGANVMICYKNGKERAEKLVASLPKANHRTQYLAVEDSAAVRQAAENVGRAYGRVDILVNSAGFTKPVPHANLDALDDALIDSIMIANVRGPFSMIRAMVPLMRTGGDSVVVNVSSISAFTGSGSNIAYCASKAALDTMTISLARVLGPDIRLLCVSPAAVATDFVAGRDRAALEKIAQATPLKRVCEPEDVALSIMACITHLKMSTGVRIIADGGRSVAG
ncbi:MAG: SDR family oxidoreductase [Hyphomicrobiales bacterium]|nr:SDR family oxidoreductase [Hyphomicrobiales bacterium]